LPHLVPGQQRFRALDRLDVRDPDYGALLGLGLRSPGAARIERRTLERKILYAVAGSVETVSTADSAVVAVDLPVS
jgi:hypothetical protein